MFDKGTGSIFLWLADIFHLIDMLFISYMSHKLSEPTEQEVTNDICGIN